MSKDKLNLFLALCSEAYQDLNRYKKRSAIIIFMISLTLFIFILTMALCNGLYTRYQGELNRAKTPMVGFSFKPTSIIGNGFVNNQSTIVLASDLADFQAAFPQILYITPGITGPHQSVSSGNLVLKDTPVLGKTDFSGKAEYDIVCKGGRFISKMDVLDHNHVVVLTPYVSQYLFGTNNSVGKTIYLFGDLPFTVIGVLDPKENSFSGNGTNILIPYSIAQDLFQEPSVYFEIELKPGSNLPSFIHSFSAYLAYKYHFSSEDTVAIELWTHQNAYVYLSQLICGLQSFFILCGLMIFLACNISIANFMYYLTGTRKVEIGIKMALGANNGMIKFQFIIEFILYWLIANIGGGLLIALLFALLNLVSLPDWLGTPNIDVSLYIMGSFFILMANLIAIYRPINHITLNNPKIILGAS